jgi:endoglucanase
VCVDAVGCSAAFDIDPWVWVRAATQVARAAFHQRSGIAFDASVTSVRRPRPYHPDDGTVVHWSSQSLMEDFNGLDPDRPQFTGLRDGALDGVAEDAYGGHMDAGDWDRRIQHLEFSRTALELVASFPEVFARLDLDVPESGDAVPDLVDEALWSLDLYRRLQRADGAVSGGVEAAEHPRPGTVSWTETLDVYAYAPDPWSSYRYAGVAAQAAAVLEGYGPARADAYRRSALAAFRWADGQRVQARYRSAVAAQRATAAVALYALTGVERWHQVFLRTSPFRGGTVELLECHVHEWCDAAWLYARLAPERTDPVTLEHVLTSLRRNGEAILAAVASTSFAWAVEHPGVPLVWGLGPAVPKTVGLLRAYLVTGDERFRRAAVTAASFTLGANPLDTSFVTGMGTRAVRNPLVVDQRVGGLPVWPGTPVFGPHDIGLLADEGWIERYLLAPAGTFPALADTPYLWSWFDLPDIAQMNEYTMHQSHAPALSTFGTLAALALSGDAA